MSSARFLLLLLLPQLVIALPILPEHLFCRNASVRIALGEQSTSAGLACNPRAFGERAGCCQDEDVEAVLMQLEHSIQFGMRHLGDRQEFHGKYAQASFGEHPCAPVAEVMVSTRIQLLEQCHGLSQEVLGLMRASVQHALCAACRGGAPGGGKSAEEFLRVAEEGLASEWQRLSRTISGLYEELRRHDAAVTAGLKQAGQDACLSEYVEALRRGVPAPAAHLITLRPWEQPGEGVRGFREAWGRWIDSLLALSSEFAESLLAEVEGLLLSLYHCLSPESPAHGLLARPPPDSRASLYKATASGPRLPALLPPSAETVEVTLLVVMPNPGTNLRFDFANDGAQLGQEALARHIEALSPLVSQQSRVRVVLVTANQEQGGALARAFAGRGGGALVVWRRFALFQADELAALFAHGGGAAAERTPRAVAIVELPAGGDAQALVAAAQALAGVGPLPLPGSWPPGLRPARASDWPARAAVAKPLSLASRPQHASEGHCPELAGVLQDYLEFHRSVRARLAEGRYAGERVLVYRCSALGFCGGHGDRLNGLLGVFLLAVASRRAFFIDAPRPVPMSLLFSPRRRPEGCGQGGEFLLDWRLHGAVAAVGRRTNYNDRYNDLVADLPWLLAEEREPVVVLHSNQRITVPVLQSPEARALLGATVGPQLLATPFLHAELLELLLEPTPLLAERTARVHQAALAGRRYLLAVHFRAGNRSPQRWSDPPRHQLADLESFLSCAEAVERHMGWRDEEVAWYIATDTAEVASVPLFAELRSRGKLAYLPAGHDDAAIIHLDRSPMPLAVNGLVDTWAQWLTIAASDAAVLSTSNFGVTAAEAGRIRHAFLGPHGCLPTDLTAA